MVVRTCTREQRQLLAIDRGTHPEPSGERVSFQQPFPFVGTKYRAFRGRDLLGLWLRHLGQEVRLAYPLTRRHLGCGEGAQVYGFSQAIASPRTDLERLRLLGPQGTPEIATPYLSMIVKSLTTRGTDGPSTSRSSWPAHSDWQPEDPPTLSL